MARAIFAFYGVRGPCSILPAVAKFGLHLDKPPPPAEFSAVSTMTNPRQTSASRLTQHIMVSNGCPFSQREDRNENSPKNSRIERLDPGERICWQPPTVNHLRRAMDSLSSPNEERAGERSQYNPSTTKPNVATPCAPRRPLDLNRVHGKWGSPDLADKVRGCAWVVLV